MAMQEESERDIYRQFFRVIRRDIWYLHFIIESYEGLATLSTVDPKKGIVQIMTPVSRVDDMTVLLRELAKEIILQELTEV